VSWLWRFGATVAPDRAPPVRVLGSCTTGRPLCSLRSLPVWVQVQGQRAASLPDGGALMTLEGAGLGGGGGGKGVVGGGGGGGNLEDLRRFGLGWTPFDPHRTAFPGPAAYPAAVGSGWGLRAPGVRRADVRLVGGILSWKVPPSEGYGWDMPEASSTVC
jgi:hypothetical protein